MVITPLDISHCMPDTNDLSSICPSAHHPALFFTQLGISESCAKTLGTTMPQAKTKMIVKTSVIVNPFQTTLFLISLI
jgi:hypothetical protein